MVKIKLNKHTIGHGLKWINTLEFDIRMVNLQMCARYIFPINRI